MDFRQSLFAALVLTAILPHTAVRANLGLASYVPVLLTYFLVCLYAIKYEDNLQVPMYALLSVGVIWSIGLYHLFDSATSGTLQMGIVSRVPVFVVFTFVGLFVVPRLVSLQEFSAIIARIAGLVVVIGLPSAVAGTYSLAGIEWVAWSRQVPVPLVERQLWSITSVFTNPNPLTLFVMMGTFAALLEVLIYRNRSGMVLFVINLLGVYLAHGRAGMAATALGLGIVCLYYAFDRWVFDLGVICGGVLGFIGFLMVTGFLPGPELVRDIDLTGRRLLWEQSSRAIELRPILGYGPGDTSEIITAATGDVFPATSPHNSYIRMFVTVGLFGGGAYLLFVSKTILDLWRVLATPEVVVLFALLSAIAVTQLFEAYSLFGLSLLSILSTIFFGYGITIVADAQDRIGDSTEAT